MNIKKILSLLVLPGFLAGAQLCRAGSHTWSGAVNNSWSNPGNWSSGGAPMFGETNLSLIFPASATRYAATNGVGNFAINTISIQGNNYAIGGYGITLVYNGVGASILASGTNNEIGLPITLNTSNLGFTIGTASALTLSGALSGPGSFTKFGRGKLILAGAFDNTYAGVTKVLGGQLYLNQGDLFNATAIPGDLVLSDPNNTTIEVDVLYQRDNQVADTAKVTVNQNAYFALQGHSDAIGGLVLEGGQVLSDLISPSVAGTLTLFGNVSVLDGAPVDAAIAGHLSLGGATRAFDVTNGAKLHVSAQISDGSVRGGITKSGEGTLRLAGASSFSGNVAVNQGVVEVLHNSALGSAIGGTIVQNGATLRLGGVNVANEHLYLNGAGYAPWFNAAPGALEVKTADATWSGPVTLQSDSTIDVAENVTLTLSGMIDGPGSLTLLDLGTIFLAGGSANTYAGATLAHGGLLLLGKSAGIAVSGPFFVGQTNTAANSQYIPHTNVVRLIGSHQFNTSAPLNVDVTGLLDLNGFSQTVGPLTMNGGIITNTFGTLTLNGNVDASTPWNNFPAIYGPISLGGTNRTFTSWTPGALFLEGPVSDGGKPAGVIKMGPYGLWLSNSNNTYSGVTQIKEGFLVVPHSGCLGSGVAGTVVEKGGELHVGLNFHGASEFLNLNDGSSLVSIGINSWDGPILVSGNARIIVDTAANNESLDINGPIMGAGGLTFELGGTLRFGGSQANTYSGATKVLGDTTWGTLSTLELRKPNGVVAIPGPLIIGNATNPPAREVVRLFAHGQIADDVPVTVNASGLLDLNNQSDMIGSLAGSGLVDLKLGALTNGGNNADTIFSGTIAGTSFAAQFFKEGSGALTLTGTNTLSGSMMINNGHLYANGQQTSSIFVNPNGRLHGRGTVGFITDQGGSTMPGNNWTAPTHGALFSQSVTLDTNTHFNVDLGGIMAGVNYDQLRVTGTVKLGGATLVATLGFSSAISNKFIIIDNDGNDPVNEPFKDLQEGATLMIGGAQFQITYQGGDGNDVVLSQITALPGPQISEVEKLGNGSIQISATGSPDTLYNVEATQDFNPPVQWTNIGTAMANAQGQLQFTDSDAPNHSMRFYRFVLP